MCWLYNHSTPQPDKCELCRYLKNASQSAVKTTNKLAETYCATVRLSEITRRAKIFYIERKIFNEQAAESLQPTPIDSTVSKEDEHSVDATLDWLRKKSCRPLTKFDRFYAKRRKREHSDDITQTAAHPGPAEPETDLVAVGTELVTVGTERLLRFLKVLDIFGSCPWSGIKFKQNEQILKRLVASHLGLIVGKSEYEKNKSELLALVESTVDLSNMQNLVWITNRQQGKTSTLSKFLAALSLLSVTGGSLVCVYSTSRDRAQELVSAAKQYLYWVLKDPKVASQLNVIGIEPPSILVDNFSGYSVKCAINPAIVNRVSARPKSVASCRGDAPACVIIDEVAFVEANWWWKFAYPLLQIGSRVFTLATTPGPLGEFFDDFCKSVEDQNAKSNFFFFLVNHSLACPTCYKAGCAPRCCHKLFLIPPWKSLLRFEHLRKLVPAKTRGDFEKEVYGVIDRGKNSFLPEKLVETIFKVGKHNLNTSKLPGEITVYVGVDPPSHDVSSMGIVAVVYGTESQAYLIGMSEVPMAESNTDMLLAVVKTFTCNVLNQLVDVGKSMRVVKVVPVVESNNCAFLSGSIAKAIASATKSMSATYWMPYSKDMFPNSIVEQVGVLTTEDNKMAAIANLYTYMFEGRIKIPPRCTTVGPVRTKNYTFPKLQETVDLLKASLKSFKRDAKGKVSGKTANTNDDLAMALMITLYWSFMIRAQTSK